MRSLMMRDRLYVLLGLLLSCLWWHYQCSGTHSPTDPERGRVHCMPCATQLPIHLLDVSDEMDTPRTGQKE